MYQYCISLSLSTLAGTHWIYVIVFKRFYLHQSQFTNHAIFYPSLSSMQYFFNLLSRRDFQVPRPQQSTPSVPKFPVSVGDIIADVTVLSANFKVIVILLMAEILHHLGCIKPCN